MNPEKILFIDTETGGTDPLNHSLLSIGLVIWQNFKILACKEILINDGFLNVTEEALRINGINISEHKENALMPSDAIKELDDFLSLYFDKGHKIILAGHNINFDVNFLKHFLSKNNYPFNKRFSHRHIDTATILHYLYLVGKFEQPVSSSDEAFKFFKISVNKRHSALGDAIAITELFSKLIERFKFEPEDAEIKPEPVNG